MDELFPFDILRHLILMASWVVHDEAVRKAVAWENLAALGRLSGSLLRNHCSP